MNKGRSFLIAKRYTKANNKYMCHYDPNKPSTFITYVGKNNLTFITYFGKNNLYGWAMSEYLPYRKFEFLKNVDVFLM